ncbi:MULTISPECIES: GIY-YIG nuclease family protein [unclassified Micromonospora]|uniref:GIY-YIG nuclease family protein n=1 Tax=unclassified Micromonospora TaxID=2617518 RepID=UPI00332DF54D
MTNRDGYPLPFALTPPELDAHRPEGKEWRHSMEGCALTVLLHGGAELIDAASEDLRPSDFDGDHRVICQTMLAMCSAGDEVTPDSLAQRVSDTISPKVLADLIAAHERGMPRRTTHSEPLWLQRASLNDFLREIRRDLTALYFWYDTDDVLLYIGITGDLATRQTAHAKRSTWAEFADHSTVQRLPTRLHALDAEREAIKAERPLFNVTHNDTPEARARLVAYLIEHGRADLLVPAVSRG